MKKKLLIASFVIACLTTYAQKWSSPTDQYNHYASQYNRLRNEGKIDSLFLLARTCYGIAEKAKNDSLLSDGYNLLGNAFLINCDFPSALEYYFRSIQLAEKMKDLYRIGTTAGNLSFTYFQLGNYVSGIEYGKKGIAALLAISELDQNRYAYYYSNLANAYDNTGISFQKSGKNDSALYYLQSAYATVLKTRDLFEKSAFLTDLAVTYAAMKENAMAEDHFKQAVLINNTLRSPNIEGYIAKYHGEYLLQQGRLAEVRQVGRAGITAAMKSGAKLETIDIALLLQQAYEPVNKDSAYFFAKMVNAYRDSVFSTQKMLGVQNANLKREIQQKEALSKQEQEAEERRHNLQYAAIALVLVSFIIVFFLFSHSIIANQKLIRFLGVIALLIVFEFLNLLVHPWLGAVTHESPVLMLLAMVCIASLLIPLHHRLEYWITHKLVEKNKRIKVAAAKKIIARLEPETTN